jgi:hypothetical protein
MAKHATLSRAKHRIVQGNPILGDSSLKIRGNATPPNPPAVVANPVARPRFSWNQCPKALMLEVHNMDDETPPTILKAKRN